MKPIKRRGTKANKKYGYFKAGEHSAELRKACNFNSLIITVSQYFFQKQVFIKHVLFGQVSLGQAF